MAVYNIDGNVIDKQNYDNKFVSDITDTFLNISWTLNNEDYLSFAESVTRIGTGIPYVVDYDLHLSATSGYQFAVMEIIDAEVPTPLTSLACSVGWVEDYDIVKNTNFYFQIRKSDNSQIDPSEFLNALTSAKTKKELSNVFDLCLFAGQSNMAGRGISNQQWPETAPTIVLGAGYEFKAISNPKYISPISEPFGKYENNPNGIDDGTLKTGSMVTAFANAYYANNGNIPIIAVSASKGGSGIDDWQPNTAYLNDAVARFNAAKAFAISRGYTIRHMFLVWCQGEHDWETYSTYSTRWQNMFDVFKANGIEKCLMVRIGNTNTGDGHFANIIATETIMAQENEDIIMVSTDFAGMAERGLMQDDLHYYQKGYNECGKNAGINSAFYVVTGKEPTMYDSEDGTIYFTHKN